MKMTNGLLKKIIFSIMLLLLFTAVKNCTAQSYYIPSEYEIEQYNKIGEAKTVVSSSDAIQKAKVEYLKNQELIGGLNQKIIYSKSTNKDTSNFESYLDQLRKKQTELDAVLKKSATYDIVVAEGKIAGANGQKKFFTTLTPEELDSLSKEQKESYEILKDSDPNAIFGDDLNAAKEKNAAAIEEEQKKEALARSTLPQPVIDPFSCWAALSVFPDLDCVVAKFVYWVPYKISENLLKLSGIVFDYVIDFTIVNMKVNIYGATGTSSAIEVAWVIFRDIANILFIFALIYIAIKTILQGTGQTAKSIGTVIIVAVLINFSLFFTKVIIDVTNTAAISFYNSIVETVGTAATPRDADIYANNGRSLAESIIMQTGIGSSYKVSNGVLAGGWMSIAKQLLLTALIFLIVAVILFFAVFLLITRFIILAVVMLMSSLAFGSYIFPKLKSQISDKWWSALIGQSFVAPVFMIMLFITFKIMGSIGIKYETTGNGFGDFFTLQPDILLKYTLVIGMLIFSIKTAKTLSDQAGGMAGTITKVLGGGALGLAAWAGRNTIGGVANSVASNMKPTTAFGGFMKRRFEGVAKSGFDVRSSRIGGAIIKQTGIDLDKAPKDASYINDAAARAKNAKKRADSISNKVDPSDPQGRTYKEIYERSNLRKFTGGWSRQVQLKDLDKLKTKAADIKRKSDALVAAEKTRIRNASQAPQAIVNTQQREIDVIKGALAQSIATNNGQEPQLRTRLAAAENAKSAAQQVIDGITSPPEHTAAVDKLNKELAETNLKIENFDKDKEPSPSDLMKEMNAIKQAQNKT